MTNHYDLDLAQQQSLSGGAAANDDIGVTPWILM